MSSVRAIDTHTKLSLVATLRPNVESLPGAMLASVMLEPALAHTISACMPVGNESVRPLTCALPTQGSLRSTSRHACAAPFFVGVDGDCGCTGVCMCV